MKAFSGQHTITIQNINKGRIVCDVTQFYFEGIRFIEIEVHQIMLKNNMTY